MKKIMFPLGFVLLALAGCAPRDPYPYHYETFQLSDPACSDTTECTEVYISYPVFDTQDNPSILEINRRIYAQAAGGLDQSVEESADSFMMGYRVYADDMKKLGSDTPVFPWTLNNEVVTLVSSAKMIVTECKFYTFTGGAHGNYGSNFRNYDVPQGKIYQMEEVFSDTTALQKIVTESFIEQYRLDPDLSFDKQGYFIEDDLVPLTDNFALLPFGVLFYYNVYEIAPYASGPVKITVPYDRLKDVLEIKPDFTRAEVSELDQAGKI